MYPYQGVIHALVMESPFPNMATLMLKINCTLFIIGFSAIVFSYFVLDFFN